MPEVPFARSYWARPGLLLAGCYPGDKEPIEADRKLRELIRCGVSTIINLMEEKERGHNGVSFVPYAPRFTELAQAAGKSSTCLRFPIRDCHIPTIDEMREILDAIDQALARDERVYVHCWGGRGRTGTVVACHLLRHGLAPGGDALAALHALTRHDPIFHPTPEMPVQKEFVRNWKPNE